MKTGLVNDYDFDHILETDFSSENDRLTGYNRLSLKCSTPRTPLGAWSLLTSGNCVS